MTEPEQRPRPAADGARPWPPESLDDELAAIDLATSFFRDAGSLHHQVFQRYGINGTRFWQVVNLLIDRPDIIAQRTRACRRLDEQRTQRRTVRAKVRAQTGKRRPWGSRLF